MQSQKIPILIVGATGHLGKLITQECLKCDHLEVSILIRDKDSNADCVQQIESKGGRVLKGDLEEPETLKDATKGIHTIISCVLGEEKIILDGQNALLQDALKNDVKRFVPSDFTINYENITESNQLITPRKEFRKLLEASNVKGLYIYSGWFIETYFRSMNYILEHFEEVGLNLQERGIPYWGNVDQKIDFSTYADTAKYVAYAVSDQDRYGDLYLRTSCQLNTSEVAKAYSNLVGQEFKPIELGSLESLDKIANEYWPKYQEKKKEFNKDCTHSESMYKPEFFWGVLIHVAKFVYSGQGLFSQNNISEFPDVHPLSFEEFLKQNQEIRFKFDQVCKEKSAGAEASKEKDLKTNITEKKDQWFTRIEDAVDYLTKNAHNISEDLKSKLQGFVGGKSE